jgi:hypothetical protein
MRVSCHKKLRRTGIEQFANRGVVIAGIASDMFDEHIGILAFESVQFTIHKSQVASITIATDSTQRTELSQSFCYLYTTDITCVPYLVAGLEVVQVLIVPIAVGVTDDSYSLHDLRF